MNLFKKKFLRIPKSGKKNILGEIGSNAFIDWLLVLFISSITVIVLIFVGLYLYRQIISGDFKVKEEEIIHIEKKLDKNGLELILNQYEIREDKSKRTGVNYFISKDPSL